MSLQQFDYIGKQFKIGGRGPLEYDCYGLVKKFYADELNISLPLYNIYDKFDKDLLSGFIDTGLMTYFNKVDNPEYGDIGLFRFMGRDSHLVIYVDNSKVLHTMLGVNSIVERLDSPRLKGRFRGWYRYKKD